MAGKKTGLSHQPVFRAGVVVVIILTGFALLRMIFVPPTFGVYGYYRASNLDYWATRPVAYAQGTQCDTCHGERAGFVAAGGHAGLDCQSCHGPAASHPDNPGAWQPTINPDREFCARCHGQVEGRPDTVIKQIDLDQHNPGVSCVQCHDPHRPWTMLGTRLGGSKS